MHASRSSSPPSRDVRIGTPPPSRRTSFSSIISSIGGWFGGGRSVPASRRSSFFASVETSSDVEAHSETEAHSDIEAPSAPRTVATTSRVHTPEATHAPETAARPAAEVPQAHIAVVDAAQEQKKKALIAAAEARKGVACYTALARQSEAWCVAYGAERTAEIDKRYAAHDYTRTGQRLTRAIFLNYETVIVLTQTDVRFAERAAAAAHAAAEAHAAHAQMQDIVFRDPMQAESLAGTITQTAQSAQRAQRAYAYATQLANLLIRASAAALQFARASALAPVLIDEPSASDVPEEDPSAQATSAEDPCLRLVVQQALNQVFKTATYTTMANRVYYSIATSLLRSSATIAQTTSRALQEQSHPHHAEFRQSTSTAVHDAFRTAISRAIQDHMDSDEHAAEYFQLCEAYLSAYHDRCLIVMRKISEGRVSVPESEQKKYQEAAVELRAACQSLLTLYPEISGTTSHVLQRVLGDETSVRAVFSDACKMVKQHTERWHASQAEAAAVAMPAMTGDEMV